ncbi:Alpha-amylase 1, partial [Orchesella cincta]
YQRRTTMVHLFEWRWEDIALECERYLTSSFCGVQYLHPMKNAVVTNPIPAVAMKDTTSFLQVKRVQEMKHSLPICNSCTEHGTGWHSEFDARTHSFPGVPYTVADFNDKSTCPTESGGVEDYQDAVQIRNCEYVALRDLNHGKTHVREKIAEYMNKLISFGVAGFRVDLAKHMWPEDLSNIFSRLNNLPTEHGFNPGTRPFIVQEITDAADNEPIKGYEYFDNGRITEFRFSIFIGEIFRKANGHKLHTLKNFGEGWGLYQDDRVLVFVDNHDNQRGHGASGQYIYIPSS